MESISRSVITSKSNNNKYTELQDDWIVSLHVKIASLKWLFFAIVRPVPGSSDAVETHTGMVKGAFRTLGLSQLVLAIVF